MHSYLGHDPADAACGEVPARRAWHRVRVRDRSSVRPRYCRHQRRPRHADDDDDAAAVAAAAAAAAADDDDDVAAADDDDDPSFSQVLFAQHATIRPPERGADT